MVAGLYATSKVILLIIDNQVFLKSLKILFGIYYYTFTVGIIYRPPNPVDFIDHFNNAQGKLPFHSSEVYLLGDFNIVLYVLKNILKDF